MSFRRVTAGEPVSIPADTYNAWCEAAEAVQGANSGFRSPAVGGRTDWTRVRIRNDSGTDLNRSCVLGITGPLFGPTDNLAEFLAAPKLTGTTPDVGAHAGRFVVALEPIPAGQIGWALAAGVAQVHVYIEAAGDQFADVTDGQTDYLASGPVGSARILWAASETGLCYAMVLLGGVCGVARYWGTLDDDCAHDEETGVTMTRGGGGTLEGVLPPAGMNNGLVPEGARVCVETIDGEMRIVDFPDSWVGENVGDWTDTASCDVNVTNPTSGTSVFEGVKPPGFHAGTIPDGSEVHLKYVSGSGYWYGWIAPC